MEAYHRLFFSWLLVVGSRITDPANGSFCQIRDREKTEVNMWQPHLYRLSTNKRFLLGSGSFISRAALSPTAREGGASTARLSTVSLPGRPVE